MKTHYTIHKEGLNSIIIAFLIVAVPLGAILFFLILPLLLSFLIVFVGLLFWMLVCFFFRVPYRITKKDENAIIAPADGTIVQILQRVEVEYFNSKKHQISIFMSPLNVHVNSYPIDGTIIYEKYHKGKHLVAKLPKASKDNEHNTVVVKHKNGEEVLFRQIAGIMARRIVSYAKENELVKQGDEMGIIKFGSRVDVFLPLSAKINVKLNEKVQSKITHLAYFS